MTLKRPLITIGKMTASLSSKEEVYIMFYISSKARSVSVSDPEEVKKLGMWLLKMSTEMEKKQKEKEK